MLSPFRVLLVGVPKYATKSKLRTVQEKLYTVDVAMMNMRENAFSPENLGWRLETIVLIQLLRKCKLNGWDICYLKERSGECDFLVCKGNQVLQCIQVSYDISTEKTRNRELNGLKTVYHQLLHIVHPFSDIGKEALPFPLSGHY